MFYSVYLSLINFLLPFATIFLKGRTSKNTDIYNNISSSSYSYMCSPSYKLLPFCLTLILVYSSFAHTCMYTKADLQSKTLRLIIYWVIDV